MKKSKSQLLHVAAVLVGIALASVLYMWLLGRTVQNNVMTTVNELSQHDVNAVQHHFDQQWAQLKGVGLRFAQNGDQTLPGLQQQLYVEQLSSGFDRLLLLRDDGTVYTDTFELYTPETGYAMGAALPDGQNQVLTWYAGTQGSRADILYGVRLDYTVEDVHFVALFGVTPAAVLQDQLQLDSFDGRGYTGLLDEQGYYLLSAQRSAGQNRRLTLFDRLDRCVLETGMTTNRVRQYLAGGDTFSMNFTDENGVRQVASFRPIPGTGWYLMMVVPRAVFSQRIRTFTVLSMAMLAVVSCMLVISMLMRSRNLRQAVAVEAQARARADYLSTMSHEIRTPLHGLIGLNHLIRLHLYDPDRVDGYAQKAADTANYLLSLVSDFLDVSKLQTGDVDLASEPIRVQDMVETICSMQQENARSCGVNFVVNRQIVAPVVLGDEVRIKQVLMNVLGNAVKFTPKGGFITFTVRQQPEADGTVTNIFTVQDTGIGMSEEAQRQIFETENPGRAKNTGSGMTGLGMLICARLTEAMGGAITVKSTQGVGSTFTVTIPTPLCGEEPPAHTPAAAPAPVAEPAPLPAAAPAPAGALDLDNLPYNSQGMHVLVAEDDALNAEILITLLQDMDFLVDHAATGQEAVELFARSAEGEYDAILMDMQMPVLDGCRATAAIRAMDRADAATVPIFACTASVFKEDRDAALQSGMNDFLAKPIDVNDLLHKLGGLPAGEER